MHDWLVGDCSHRGYSILNELDKALNTDVILTLLHFVLFRRW